MIIVIEADKGKSNNKKNTEKCLPKKIGGKRTKRKNRKKAK